MERTFAIIKPDAVAAGKAGEILAMIEKAGFKILGLQHDAAQPSAGRGLLRRPQGAAVLQRPGQVHDRRPVVVMALEREDAIESGAK